MKSEHTITFNKDEVEEMVRNYLEHCEFYAGDIKSISTTPSEMIVRVTTENL